MRKYDSNWIQAWTRNLLACWALLALTFGAASSAQEVSDTGEAEAPYPNLDVFVDSVMETQFRLLDISAMTISIVKDGEVIFAKGYGMQNREEGIPVTPDVSLFRIGSTSKLFTWTAVMQQYERGNLDLDADVNQYLTGFQIPDTFDEPITLKHILTHTPGFEDGGLGYLITHNAEDAATIEEFASNYIPARVNKPGKYGSYSNYGTALAGYIVQNVTGVPFDEYIEQNILEPLGMNNTTFREPLPENLAGGMTVGYKREAGVYEPQPYEIIGGGRPAGSIASTASDMTKFMMAHLNGGRLGDAQILQPETAALMHSVLFQPDERLGGMAYGFYEQYINGRRLIGHGGDTFQFHTDMMLDMQANLGIFISYQTITGTKGRTEFNKIFYNTYYPAELETIVPPEDFNERAQKYAGHYSFWRRNFSTLEKAMDLVNPGFTIAPSENNTLIFSGLETPIQLVEIGDNLFRQIDGSMKVAFGEDEDGNIQDLYIDFAPFMAMSRTPTLETAFYKWTLPLISILIFFTVWVGWLYRRKEYKEMDKGEGTAIKLSLATSGLNLLFIFMIIGIFAAYQIDLFFEIPMILKLTLILPLLIIPATLGVAYFAVKTWREDYWRPGRRVHYTLVSVASLFMLFFYSYWNMLGWQYL